MRINTLINKKIMDYSPNGRLAHTAKFFLAICEINHKPVKQHSQRVALLGESVAKKLKMDAKATLFAGLLHDIGKVVLPPSLFDGHDISDEEYAKVKKHALRGFRILKELHYFVALCAGLHHKLYKHGYGLSPNDFPKRWSKKTIKKLIAISIVISVCDDIDASMNRRTKLRNNNNHKAKTLAERLMEKYPGQELIVKTALQLSQRKKH
ncbi:MAG: HD domain-containing protein [Planctomycetes bacterium]|nr:HD domain-containing protein [Planctomycetota bacterium]